MSRQDALHQYIIAWRMGQRYYKACTARGEYPYTSVLSEIFTDSLSAGQVKIGTVDIPTELIVGTATAGRRTAFAGNFMPLLDDESEFAMKWISLCQAHLGDEGIRDPIVCYEYLGKFYVVEGNKRVSVLKSYDAPSIPGIVTRLMPPWSEDREVQLYYEFLPFHHLSGIYDVSFTEHGGFVKLLAWMGCDPEHVWTREERQDFRYRYRRFREAFDKLNTERLAITPGDALLIWAQFNPYETLEKSDLSKSLAAVWADVKIFANGSKIALSTSPETEGNLVLPRVFGIGRINHLQVAFVHAFDPESSNWTAAHETGRKHLENVMGDRVTVKTYLCDKEDPLEVMERAVQEGAQVLFATTPPLIGACRQLAVKYPNVKVLNCSLSMPYSGVRTYYSRIFEAKFITGALAGAMAQGDRIGYVASYPIIGTIAAINAFALGARMTNPRARISLHWSCLPGNPVQSLMREGVSVISNRESVADQPHWAWEWGTYLVGQDGDMQPLASPQWKWGKFYEGVVQSVFDGSWNALSAKEQGQAVNYWWGMSSGAIDVTLWPDLPDGVKQMASILKQGIIDGNIRPFDCRLTDQAGVVRSEAETGLSVEEIMDMDWLLENVDGSIPAFEDLLPVSQNLVRLLGLHRDEIAPMPEEGML